MDSDSTKGAFGQRRREAAGRLARVAIETLRRTPSIVDAEPLIGAEVAARAEMLLDVYGHFMPEESGRYADALSASPDGTRRHRAAGEGRARTYTRIEERAPSRASLVAQPGIEPGTRGFSVRCSTS